MPFFTVCDNFTHKNKKYFYKRMNESESFVNNNIIISIEGLWEQRMRDI